MTQRVYYGSVCKGPHSFGISFIDFPGCVSAGDTMENIIAMGHEALQLHIDGMVEDGETIPEPSEVTLERTAAEFDDPDDPVEGESWVAVVPILIDVRSQDADVSVPIKASLFRKVGEVTTDREKFIMDATRRELDRLRNTA
ncbi:type II toxin-antitoxin system HicB family antitoxin [Blastomonas sp.]|uniref:type II toxin-antitoxin system HicB family antitoxin n=1 Tax=Blastomonas sp. TaxID=1909299 RepID=UPI00359454EA